MVLADERKVVRPPASHAGGRAFEPRQRHEIKHSPAATRRLLLFQARVEMTRRNRGGVDLEELRRATRSRSPATGRAAVCSPPGASRTSTAAGATGAGNAGGPSRVRRHADKREGGLPESQFRDLAVGLERIFELIGWEWENSVLLDSKRSRTFGRSCLSSTSSTQSPHSGATPSPCGERLRERRDKRGEAVRCRADRARMSLTYINAWNETSRRKRLRPSSGWRSRCAARSRTWWA
jgi:hypothetical protein